MSRREAKRVFICSKYAGDIEHNVEVTQALCRMAIKAGHAPFAPHLLYTQFLDEDDQCERNLGISLGLQFMEACDEVWAYVGEGVSEGLRREMKQARCLGKPVVILREVQSCALT